MDHGIVPKHQAGWITIKVKDHPWSCFIHNTMSRRPAQDTSPSRPHHAANIQSPRPASAAPPSTPSRRPICSDGKYSIYNYQINVAIQFTTFDSSLEYLANPRKAVSPLGDYVQSSASKSLKVYVLSFPPPSSSPSPRARSISLIASPVDHLLILFVQDALRARNRESHTRIYRHR